MFYPAASNARSKRPDPARHIVRRTEHVWWPIATLIGCGAVSELDPNPPPKQGSPSASSAAAAPSNTSAPGKKPAQGTLVGTEPMDGVDWPTFELGECVLGERPSSLEECYYLGDGRCYRNVAMACSCVCPKDVDSYCFEGIFPNEWDAIDVSCTAK